MNSQGLLRLLLGLLCVEAALARLTPALGNSVALETVTRNGSQAFGCSNGENWRLKNSTATLVNAANSSLVDGDYFFIIDEEASVIQWSILNSLQDQNESGQNYTFVTGKRLISSTHIDQLYEIDSRSDHPITARYSFILSHGDDAPPPQSDCSSGEIATVPFQRTFTFYTQDVTPPPTGALGVSVPENETLVQSLFSSGSAVWTHSPGKWVLQSAEAILSDVPGGPVVGSLTIRPGYSATWSIHDESNGWNVTASSIQSTTLAAEDWPWQLYSVTSATETGLGPLANVTYVQFISTTGGMPPTDMDVGENSTSSEFSGISWFYTS